MTVVDTSLAVDYLLGRDEAGHLPRLADREGTLAAPDVLTFETLAVLRRLALRGDVGPTRAAGAVADLGDLPVELFPSLPLRRRAWEMRGSLTIGDGLFVALAERLAEPLVTRDAALAGEAPKHARLDVLLV